ncbi:MAG: hypothetical protein Q6364_06560 [Candidatus Hermodarchaeota archaeon]|nr:hypothetical protein [Candidatus Hermodarchaeota archaeon]
MSLGTVDVVLKFAIDLEGMAAAFYETATTITQSQELKSLFEALLLQGQSRIQTLIQLRRLIPSPVIKEAVSNIESSRYRPITECPPSCPDTQLIELATNMEAKILDFYEMASDQLGFIEEVPGVFDHLAEDHRLNQKRLQTGS